MQIYKDFGINGGILVEMFIFVLINQHIKVYEKQIKLLIVVLYMLFFMSCSFEKDLANHTCEVLSRKTVVLPESWLHLRNKIYETSLMSLFTKQKTKLYIDVLYIDV